MIKQCWRKAVLFALASLLVLASIAGIALWRDPFLLVKAENLRLARAAGLQRHEVEVAGHRWVYAERADARASEKPVLVMIHGFTGSKENWYPLARALGDRYRLVMPDLPGWGESQRIAGQDYGFVAQSRRVAGFLRAVSPDRPVVLLGHSMGGGIVALAAADSPQEVARVGLFDAAGVRFRDNRFGAQVLAGENPFAVDDPASLQRYIDTVFHVEADKPVIPWPVSAVVAHWRARQAAFEQQVLDRIGRSDERFLPGEAAARIRQPALLLWCRQDAVIDPSALDLYAARIPRAAKVMLDGCGHMSIMEKPAEVAAAVTQLIERGTAR